MRKKPFSFLDQERALAASCHCVHKLDVALNQGALFVLQQLVHAGDWLTQSWQQGAAFAQPYYHSCRRQARQAIQVIQAIQKYQGRQDLMEHIQHRISHHTMLLVLHPELLSKMIELHLHRGAFLVMQCLVIKSDAGAKWVYWTGIKVSHLAQTRAQTAQTRVQTRAQTGYAKLTAYRQEFSLEQCFAKPSWQPIYALVKPAMFGLILTGAVISATSNADVADEMKVLIEQKKAVEAYQLGTKHPEMMGDPLFDYFYGVAAVEAGHTSLGVLSLERVLLNDPNNDLVRLELARAYYAQGEYQRAKDEFEAVKKSQPPAGVVSTINVYLDDIKAKEGQYKVTYGFYVELGMGYNNNVNAATAVNNIILPYIGPVQLNASSLPKKSMFGYDSIGANVAIPIDSSVSIFANANTSAQRYSQADGYDLNVTNATTGVKIADGPNTYKIAGFGSIAQIDQTPVPNTYGAGGEYVRQLSDTDSVMAAVGSTVLQYPSQFNAYNSNLKIATVGYRKLFPTTTWKPVVDFSVNTAHQTDTSNRPDLGRRIAGGSIQVSMLPSEKLGLTIGAGYAQSKYDANDLLYQTNRTDNLYSGNAVLQYKLTKDLSARMEVTYYNNLSNLNLYGYEQWTGAIKLRYDWNSN